MSEYINNREYRQNVIKDILKELHEGKSVEDVKQKFEEAFDGVSATEISEAEGALIAQGLPVEEVQKLCDVHAAVFKGSIQEIHQPTDATEIPGHPANILKRENRAIERIIEKKIKPLLDTAQSGESIELLKEGLDELGKIDIHYSKKENLFFPFMEKYGITAPPKVMWGVDDEIRDQLKEVKLELPQYANDVETLREKVDALILRVNEMIFKEENILIPMLLETLTVDEWKQIADDSSEIGYLIKNIPVWNPTTSKEEKEIQEEKSEPGAITFPTGVLKVEEIIRMLDTLPLDITFVDKDDTVKYFSQGADRIFPRTKSVIGRNVSNCHPPASVHIVEKIVEDFKSGKKDHEDFWINMAGRLVYIRYFAVRSETGEYLGVLEVTQDIKPIQEITGEKRLVSE
ncbi:hypothetical protein EDD66_107128 [Mobilisporobacter senegalensis]|uniref:PAC domain-containing protein n=1 Tax=Mobilisporobacter senegalensis TaxID=1329262 RepID=A0A3N1XKH1_9FIRM|nr:DUF438 domain-containing protein [Mobilisporobacter senegalensis]ROR27214.1 hypothetical protein EDD66_107128 [Mobilisporobacter senegalensis]